MYPTVVIVLVETRRSICEISQLNAGGLAGPVTSNAHAATLECLSLVEPVHSMTENEAESQRSWGAMSRNMTWKGSFSKQKGQVDHSCKLPRI